MKTFAADREYYFQFTLSIPPTADAELYIDKMNSIVEDYFAYTGNPLNAQFNLRQGELDKVSNDTLFQKTYIMGEEINFDEKNKLELVFYKDYTTFSSNNLTGLNNSDIASQLQAIRHDDGSVNIKIIDAADKVNIYTSAEANFSLYSLAFGTNATVNFNIVNGTSVKIIITKNGTGTIVYNASSFILSQFSINNLTAGVYNITITNTGDDNHLSSVNSTLFTVYRAKSSLNITNVVNATFNTASVEVSFDVNKSSIDKDTFYLISNLFLLLNTISNEKI